MRPIYIWQYPEWPDFTWDNSRLITLLSEVRNHEGVIKGMVSGLGFDLQSRAALDTMTTLPTCLSLTTTRKVSFR